MTAVDRQLGYRAIVAWSSPADVWRHDDPSDRRGCDREIGASFAKARLVRDCM